MARILYVEDDQAVRVPVQLWLENEGYKVNAVETATEALRLLKDNTFDVLALDWELPDQSGLDVMQEYRCTGGIAPILMLTGRDAISDKEQGYNAGADDYLTKPFQLRELSMRIKALLRRSPVKLPTSELSPGDTFAGRYEIDCQVAEGNMGTVYKAAHKLLARAVAVKVVRPQLAADAKAMGRLWLEAKSASTLSHPHIVSLLDFGLADGHRPYLVMDYIDGKTIEALLGEADHFEIARAVNLTVQLCSAISYMHERGMLHRDIKPANLMVIKKSNGEDFLKIVDLGLVKHISADDEQAIRLTVEGDVFGTPLYMSPEQSAGLELDCRSDIYSIGCLMYEMLTGSAPFTGKSSLELAFRRVVTTEKVLSDVRADLKFPAKLEQIVQKAMARQREERYDSAAALSFELRQFWLEFSASFPI